MKYNCLRK